MKKTIMVTLSGTVFHIEEDAYKKLKNYLDSIKKYYGSSNDFDEIVSDIENSIANKLLSGKSERKEVVTEKEIEDLIGIMGTVEDFMEAEDGQKVGEQDHHQEAKGPKRLYRNPDDEIIAGVCSGIAEYLGIDPVIIRILFVISIFFGGTGIWLYLLLFIVMPVAETNSQKLEMRGIPVTIERLEKAAKETAKDAKEKIAEKSGTFKNIIFFPFKVAGMIFGKLASLLKRLAPIARVVVGACLAAGSLFVIAFFSFLAAVAIFNVNEMWFGFPIKETIGLAKYVSATVAGYFAMTLPVLIGMLLGISLLKKRNILTLGIAGMIIGLWILAGIVAGVLLIDAFPKVKKNYDESRKAAMVSRQLEVSDFDKVVVKGNVDVNLLRADSFKVEVKGKDESMGDVMVERKENEDGKFLEVGFDDKRENRMCFFCDDVPAEVNISMPSLLALSAGEDADINVTGFEGDNLEIILSDGSFARVDARNENQKIRVIGDSSLKLDSPAKNLEIIAEDSSDIDISGFRPVVASFDLQGNSSVKIRHLLAGEPAMASDIRMKLSDSSDFSAHGILSDNITMEIGSYSSVSIDGKCRQMKIKALASSSVDAFGCETETAEVEANENGKIKVNVSGQLKAKAGEGSWVYYTGEADVEPSASQDSLIKKTARVD